MKATLAILIAVLTLGTAGIVKARLGKDTPKQVKAAPQAQQPAQQAKAQPIQPAQPVAKAPPGLPNTVTVTISLDPKSQPEGTDNPTFAGTVVTCTWNGSFYRGIGPQGLLVDLIYNDPDVGGWKLSYTGYACAQALGVKYAICDGWMPVSKTNAPWPDPAGWVGTSTVCKRIKLATIPPNPLPIALDATYDVQYRFMVGP
jgi:hypothetical protein